MRAVPRDVLKAFLAAVAPGLTHGSVTITLHDGKPKAVKVEESLLLADEQAATAPPKPPPGRPR